MGGVKSTGDIYDLRRWKSVSYDTPKSYNFMLTLPSNEKMRYSHFQKFIKFDSPKSHEFVERWLTRPQSRSQIQI